MRLANVDQHSEGAVSLVKEQRILQALAHGHELSGRDLAAGVAKLRWLYVVLARMEERGWIEGRFEDGDPPRRRLYRITDAGRAALIPVLPIAKVIS
jgi:DNA-binding PadR family transcriptional regulator